MKPVGRQPPKTIVSNQKELSFSKALTDDNKSSKQLNKTPGSGGKERLFPGQQYCGMLYKTVHSTLIAIDRKKKSVIRSTPWGLCIGQ